LQEDYQDSRISLSQRAYIIADSLRETSKAVFLAFIMMLFYLLFVLLALFVPSATGVQATLEFLRFWIPFTIVIISGLMIWYYQRARKGYRQLNDWNKDYLQQAYILTFDTTLPAGNSTGEKVFSLAKLIFPELRSDYVKFSPYFSDLIKYYFKKKLAKSKEQTLSTSLNYKIDAHSFDLAFRTIKGYFIVKDFSNKVVTIKDLQELIDLIRAKFRDKYQRTYVHRVVCIAKQYDQSFLQRQTLEEKMTKEIKANFDVDLLIEDKVGYSVLWVG
jgi:uncharacterized membrane protein (DUF485 family)